MAAVDMTILVVNAVSFGDKDRQLRPSMNDLSTFSRPMPTPNPKRNCTPIHVGWFVAILKRVMNPALIVARIDDSTMENLSWSLTRYAKQIAIPAARRDGKFIRLDVRGDAPLTT